MRRTVLVLVLAALTLPLWSQEVAVFVDHRSLIVQSHKVDGDWTYFKVGNGEMAVPSSSVLKITKEAGALPAPQAFSPAASPAPAQGAPGWRGEAPSRPLMATPQRPAAPAFDESDNDDEADTEADEPEPEQPEEKPAAPMVNPNMPNRPGMPPNMMPGGMPGGMPTTPQNMPGTVTNTAKSIFSTSPDEH